jgi:hypothetical protein
MTRFIPTLKSSTWILILGLLVGFIVLLWPNLAFSEGGVGAAVGNGIEAILFFMVANLTGWLLWMGGSLLDYGLNTFVINFGTIFQTGGVGVAVDQLWAMVRDLFNILFIFGLVYIGFKMILNSDDSQTKKTLISLIIAALLMNFSLFITKFVVDFTNILAAEIATAGFETVESGLEGSEKNVRVGDTFFGLMGIGPLVLEMPDNVGTGDNAAWSYIFGIGIINIVGAFAFGVGGIMLIIRFIALSVYMVLSPFMFLGMIFPGFQAMSSKYWSGFLKQAFYAPVYVVMIFFSATILNNLFRLETATQSGGSAQGGGIGDVVRSNSSIFSPTAGNVSTMAENFAGGIGPFILSVGFLIAAVQVAGKLSADGSGVMAKVGGAVNSRVRGAVRGGVRFGARNTLGNVASYGVNRAGEARREGLRRRNATLSQSDSGFQRWRARTSERITGGALDRVATTTVAGSETRADRLTRVNKEQDTLNKSSAQDKQQDKVAAAQKVLENNKDTNDSTQLEARTKAFAEIAGAGSKLSSEVIALLSKDELRTLARQGGITDENMKKIKDSGRFSNDENKEISDGRVAGISDRAAETLDSTAASAEELNTALDQLAQNIQRLSDDELKGYKPDDIISNQRLALSLSDKQIETYQSSGIASADQIRQIKETRANAQVAITDGKATGIFKNNVAVGTAVGALEAKKAVDKRRERMLKGSASDVGKLPAAVFKKKDNLKLMAPSALAERDKNGLSQTDVNDITTAIKGLRFSDPTVWNKWEKWALTPQGVSSSFDLS